MTPADYKRIAASIRRVQFGYGLNWNPNLFRAVRDTAYAIAFDLQGTSERYDLVTFMQDCGFRYDSLETGDGMWVVDKAQRGTDFYGEDK